MTDLPASIEAYLSDAGFSATEILTLKKLLEGGALTLRELAAKTGKSTGVLDAAVKKLLARRLICRETVNDTPKMLLKSLEPIVAWVKRDTEEKLETMKSRARNFETFIASLKVESTRPEISYFEGEEGIKKAYMKLLDLQVKEFLCYRPVTTKEEEDPLCAFRVQYFRERYKRGIFARALAPRTALGRRFQSRDAFEYRETQFLKEEEFPITFEKIIAGDTVACFNHAEQRACFLRYPELAQTEQSMFELLWRRAKEPLSQAQTIALALPKTSEPQIALSTRSLSTLREFFLSRTSVVIFAVGAVLAAAVTYGLWWHTYDLNRERVKERAMAIAATAAMEFDVRDIEQLRTKEDVKKPEFMKLVTHLREVKTRNENIRFVYIDRPTVSEGASWEVVADADYGTPDEDLNGDGIIEDFEQLTMPGQVYPHIDPLAAERLIKPTADFLEDEWGAYCDASAPIVDADGKAIAVLFVDIDLQHVKDLTAESFKVIYVFICLFLLFVFVRLAAFNRSLFFELLHVLRSQTVLAVLGACVLFALLVTYGMYRYTLSLVEEKEGQRLMAIASTAAAEIDARDLEPLRFVRDMERPEYQRVFEKLNEIKERNEHVLWVYVMRPTLDPTVWEFVADADANVGTPLIDPSDWNKDGKLDEADENNLPGTRYDATGQELALKGISKPNFEWVLDQWGLTLTAFAPIADSNGQNVAILAIDTDASAIRRQVHEKFVPYWWFLVIFMVLLALIPIYSWIVSYGKKVRK